MLSYLRGEQKDGSANRKDCDFCSVIALEIEDTGTHIITCIGIAFEVRKSDSEIKKFVYFSHSGKMPESEYLTEQGVCYSNQEIKSWSVPEQNPMTTAERRSQPHLWFQRGIPGNSI